MEIVKMRFYVGDSLEVAQKLLGKVPPTGRAMEEDPLHLPPLLGTRTQPELSPEALRTMAAMYLQSELEQAGIIPIAEALVEARYRLPLGNPAAAQKLEDFALRARDFYKREQRDMFFARLFGTGRGATLHRNSAVNNDFQQLLASLCNALRNYGSELGWSHSASAMAEASLRQAAINVIVSLAPRQFGSTLIAGHSIEDQLRRAIDILNDRAVVAYFQARDMWDVVRRVLGAQTPDLGRLLTRGQTGMNLLSWLADSVPALRDTTTATRLASPSDAVFAWAAQWLDASGLLSPDRKVT